MTAFNDSGERYSIAGTEFRCVRKSVLSILDRRIPVRVLDIGMSGLRGATTERLAEGQVLEGILQLGEFGEFMKVTGRVTWVRNHESRTVPGLRGQSFGLTFTRMKESDRSKLSAAMKLVTWKVRLPNRPAVART